MVSDNTILIIMNIYIGTRIYNIIVKYLFL
jgi:hypothetical protein